MGEEARVIENHIEQERERLGFAIDEIESRVKSAADWRQQFRRNPEAGLAVAFSAGLAAFLALASKVSSRRGRREAEVWM